VDKRSLWQRKALKGSRLRLLIWGVLAAFLVVVVKSLGGTDRNHRQVDHRGSPQLAVGQGKLKRQAAHGIRHVGNIRLSARQGEAANHGHAPRLEDERFRETDAIPIAFKEPGNAQPLGMIATEAGVGPIDVLESVGEPRGCQIMGSEPPAKIGERCDDRRENDADQCQS